MALFISPARKRFDENQPLYYPLGRALTRNALKDFKGSKRKETKILFLGCHDLHNVLLTIASKTTNNGTLNIHLNHSCPYSLARNALILKVISSPNFNVNCSEDLKYLWDLWYNLEWPQTTLDRFEKDVNELIKTGLPEHNLEFDSNQLKDLKDMWRNWLSSLTKLTKSPEIEKVLKSRQEFINGGGRIGKEMLEYQAKMNKSPESPMLRQLTSKLAVAMKISDFPEVLKSKLIKEVERYYRTGSCNSRITALKSVAVNPTLLELENALSLAKTPRWRVNIYSSPFMGFLPLPLDKLEKNEENIATLYCQKMLKNLVSSYRHLKNCVNFHIHWSDNLQFCLSGTSEMFDVIDCSTLADEVGLANLIVSSSPRLDYRSPDALMITESTDGWFSIASSIAGYIEEALCAPLSMIPTLYGVRPANDATLGSNVITTRGNEDGFPEITLTWRRAPRFENVTLGLSPSLELYLKNFEKKCYFEKDETTLDELKSKFFRCYTPLTYCYMVRNLVSHLENREDFQNLLLKANFADKGSQFTLTRRTIEARANQHPLTLVIANQPLTPEIENLFQDNFRAPMLRVMVIPFDRWIAKKKSGSIEKNSDVYFIDNFHFKIHGKTADRVFPTLQLIFVLPEEHGLKPNHCAVIMEMYSSTVMLFLGMIDDMEQETLEVPSSTKKQLSSCSEMAPKNSSMQAGNCRESPKDFFFNISVHTEGVPKGLYVSSDELRPCEAGHRVTFSLAEPEGVQPLTLCFPHPILVDSIDATLRRTDRSIRVVLKKAIHEPWPYDFNLKPKWDVDQLKLWKESDPKKKDDLYFHVANQKGFDRLKNYLGLNIFGNAVHLPEVRLLSPIENARNLIGTILMQVQPDRCEFFEIHKVPAPGQLQSVSSTSTNDVPFFYIRAHLPIITSPFSSPMILLSVLDTRLSEKFIKNGLLNAISAKEDFERIFRPRDKSSKTPMILWTNVDDSTNLLRYVFRLNSTKMKPSAWQEENLPLGKYSPYLATFVSPLYLDHFPVENSDSKNDSKKFTCNFYGCGKKSNATMKRCSRCKTMTYCTEKCQKADWSQHKLMCSVMEPKNLVVRVQVAE